MFKEAHRLTLSTLQQLAGTQPHLSWYLIVELSARGPSLAQKLTFVPSRCLGCAASLGFTILPWCCTCSLSMACPITHTLVGGCTGVRVLIKVSKQEQLRRTVCRSSSAGARTVTLKEILYNCPQLLHLELDHSTVSVEGPIGHDSGLLEHLSWVRSACHASDKP